MYSVTYYSSPNNEKPTLEANKQNILKKLENIPKKPGVYLMKNSFGKIIYVGKALKLKSRLTTYFGTTEHSKPKINSMINNITDFETIVTNSEKEALVLEDSLIKKLKPKYNVVLKDDKRYPSLRIACNDPYPYLEIVRKTRKDGAYYFGPFTSANNFRQTIKIINKTFKLRKCKNKIIKKNRPCINYQLGNCLGPCCKPVDVGQYSSIVDEVILFLKGKAQKLIKNISKQMDQAASEQKFELAARFRDKMFAIKKTLEHQSIVSNDFSNRDVFGIMPGSEYTIITILYIRGGVLQGQRHFKFKYSPLNLGEILSQFIGQYYDQKHYIPNEIVLPFTPECSESIQEILSKRKKGKVKIIKPVRGNKKKLIEIANLNALNRLIEQMEQLRSKNKILAKLKDSLNMKHIPDIIECFDNSNLSGTAAVTAMVVFKSGNPDKSSYRKYIIKTVCKHDDYAYLEEALTRRYLGKDPSLPLPDLLMVDGGKGQLNIAMSVLKKIKLNGKFLTIGIAKKNKGDYNDADKVYLPGRVNPVKFKGGDRQLLYLQRIRDEAHRCAVSFHRHLRNKAMIKSDLDEIKGVGKKRKAMLLKQFGSTKKIRTATLEEIMELPGISKALATEIKKKFL